MPMYTMHIYSLFSSHRGARLPLHAVEVHDRPLLQEAVGGDTLQLGAALPQRPPGNVKIVEKSTQESRRDGACLFAATAGAWYRTRVCLVPAPVHGGAEPCAKSSVG